MTFTQLVRAALVMFFVAALAPASAPAQCDRAWTASPNGVYGAAGYSGVYTTAEWTPPGFVTPVLVVGGNFLAAGDQSANNIAYWDGSLWHPLGQGFNNPVQSLTVLNGVLYAGGYFTASGATTLHYLAYWTGSAWADVSLGADGPVQALCTNGSEIIVGGQFQHVGGGGSVVRNIAHYSPANGWSTYPTTQIIGQVDSIVIFNGQPVIMDQEGGGSSDQYDHVIRRWNGSQWSAVMEVLYPGAMGVSGGNLFFSTLLDTHTYGINGACQGYFREQCLMRYDGTSLHVSVPYREVPSMVNWNGQLYALGDIHYNCGNDGGPPEGRWMVTWNGTQWLDVTSLNPVTYGGGLGTANGVLYYAGAFDHVGSNTQATNIARLSGFTWQPLAIGLDGPVTCSQPGSLIVGGSFTHEGASSVTYEASWNGQVWTSPTAFNAPVTCLSNYSSNPLTLASTVASGSFTQISGTPFNHIALHAPFAGNWTAMGTGIDAPALTTMQVGSGINHNDLIVGGQFITAGGTTCNHIARWTGAAWAAIGTAPNVGTNGDVRALANFNGLIVAGGSFTTAGGNSAAYIAGWNGTAWAPIGGGMNGAVRSLLVYNGMLLAGGDFTSPAPHLAAWNGTTWSAFNGGADGTVNTMLVSGTDLYVGGSFSHMNGGTVSAPYLATWSPTYSQWVGGSGFDGPVQTLSLSNGTLLAGGSFTHAGNQYSPYVAIAPTPGSPYVYQQPADAAGCPGQAAVFTSLISSGSWFTGLTYNWYHDGYLVNDGITASGSELSGSHTNSLTISNATQNDGGGYWCTATSGCGQSVSTNTVRFTVGGAGCCGSADFNCDGDIGTDADIESFFACLAGNCPSAPCPSSADFNADGDIGTDADIEAFFRVLAGGSC